MTQQQQTPEEQEVENLYRQAFRLVEEHRFSEARPILEECLRHHPAPKYGIPARQELARVLQELGELEGALHLRREVKRLLPDRHANLWKLAQLLANLGRYEEALAEVKEAVRLQPSNPHYRQLATEFRHLTPPTGSSGLFTPLIRLFSWVTDSKNKQLYHAALSGDRNLASTLVEQGANPNAKWKGRTLLTAAAATGNLRMVDILLELGADPNRAAQWNVTPLMLAAMHGSKETVGRLIAANADLDAVRDNGATALLEAVSCNQTETPKVLIQAGADTNIIGPRGISALAMAARNDETDLVRAFIDRGANVNTRNQSGGTALFEACKHGNLEMAKDLLKAGADASLGLNDGRTPLVAAKHLGHYDVVSLLENYLKRDVVGPVLLSWTTNHPRDAAAIALLKLALDQHEIEYFDYTRFQMDDSTDQSEAIKDLLNWKVKESQCSIEIITSEILPHEWVQYERQLLRDYKKIRLFGCLEEQFMSAVADKDEFEKLILRLNFSDGRIGVRSSTHESDYERIGYYQSVEYRESTLRLAKLLRQALLSGNWDPIRKDEQFSRCNV